MPRGLSGRAALVALGCVLGSVSNAASGQGTPGPQATPAAGQPPRPLPAEIDTVGLSFGTDVVPLDGEIWVQFGSGPWIRMLVPVVPSASTRLLVSGGAAIRIGSSTLASRSRGDRLLRFIDVPEAAAQEARPAAIGRVPLMQVGEGCTVTIGARGAQSTCKP